MLRSQRRLLLAFAPKLRFLAQTVYGSAEIEIPNAFRPKAVVLLATPQNLPRVIEKLFDLHKSGVQVVAAGVDAVPSGERNGVSQLWLDEKIKFGAHELLRDDSESSKTNWKTVKASLTLAFGSTVKLNLANTAFFTNNLATLFLLDETHPAHGHALSQLYVTLPVSGLQFTISDRWTQLTEQLKVTLCTGNLVKRLNNGPAAKYLENNHDLMSLGSKDTKVYVKVTRGAVTKKYEVIAGGGGWGAKADLLAISPEAKLQNGDLVQFYMVTPEAQKQTNTELSLFHFECVPEQTGYHAAHSGVSESLAFGCGCETGLQHNGVNVASPGEVLTFDLQYNA